MKQKIIIIALLILLASFVSAINIKSGTVYDDGTYTYTANQDMVFNILKVTAGEFYINTIPFCDSSQKSFFTTARICTATNNGGGGGTTGIVKCTVNYSPKTVSLTNKNMVTTISFENLAFNLFQPTITKNFTTIEQGQTIGVDNNILSLSNKQKGVIAIFHDKKFAKGSVDGSVIISNKGCNDIIIPVTSNIKIVEELTIVERVKDSASQIAGSLQDKDQAFKNIVIIGFLMYAIFLVIRIFRHTIGVI